MTIVQFSSMSSLRRTLAVTALIIAQAACASDALTPDRAPCEGVVTVSVTTSGKPVFTWPGGCTVSNISVVTVPGPGQAPAQVWALAGVLQSGIAYADEPTGSTVYVPPQALGAGTYRVEVQNLIGGDVLGASGNATFTR
jgi:hypothetical protein